MEGNMEKRPFNVYCNSISLSMSLHDIILNLQQQSPDENIYLGKVTYEPTTRQTICLFVIELH